MRFYEKVRLEFIKDHLNKKGYINRYHIRREFGISEVQASKDLNKFIKICPFTMAYNKSSKRYEKIS